MTLFKKPNLLLVIPLLVLLLSSLLSASLLQHLQQQRNNQQHIELSALTSSLAEQLQQEITRTLTPAFAVAGWLKVNQGQITGFNSFAAEFYPYYTSLSAISVAPDGIVAAVYPTSGNEALLDHDIFADPLQRAAALQSLKNPVLTLTGPYQLKQGGWGMVGRLPLFLTDSNEQQRFWGFINVTFRFEQLLSMQQIGQLARRGYHYQLALFNAQDDNLVLVSASTQNLAKPVRQTEIETANIRWQLTLAPVFDQQSNTALWQLILAALFCLMLTTLSLFFVRSLNQKALLKNLVAKRTLDLQTQLQRHRSLIIASHTGSWEYDPQHQTLVCSPEYFLMLGYTEIEANSRLQGDLQHNWLALLHPQDRDAALKTLQQYLRNPEQGMYQNQFRLQHKAGHWVWILSRGRLITTPTGQQLAVGLHIDISERKADELKLQLLAKLFEQSSEGLLITNSQQQVVMVNQAFCDISGYQAEDIIGKDPRLLSSGKHDQAFYQAMWQSIAREGSWRGEIWNKRKDGSLYPEWLSISKISGPNPDEVYYIGLFSDISQYKEDEAQIRFLAHYDPLTSLPNRTLLQDKTTQAIAVATQKKQALSLLFIDIDRFKQINDSLGHHVGDQVLVKIAERLAPFCRSSDTLCRLNGDEFLLLRVGCDQASIADLAAAILPAMLQPYRVAQHELVLSASIGIAVFPQDGITFAELYRHADIAMFRAKQQGRNNFCFYSAEMQHFHARQLTLENALRRAVEQNELSLVYQPQRCLTQQQLTGFEALLRWQHPTLGWISPAEFIPLAERSGLIVPIGEWVLQTALTEAASWQTLSHQPLSIAVNLSPIQFRQHNLLQQILTVLKALDFPAQQLELEITESAMIDDPAQAVKLLAAFREAGFSVAVDDFGTGYSSLSYLKRFALNKLKIDQSFVQDILENHDDRAIVSAIINLAHSLELTTIAEGVESEAQQQLLQQLGCKAVQGYYYGKPMTATQARQFIAEQSSAG